jgi:hypothetical protein
MSKELYIFGERTYNMKQLLDEARKHDCYDETSEDSCDFCGVDTIVCSINSHDIFLENWERSLGCINCCEEFGLVDLWIKWREMRSYGASKKHLDIFEKAVYTMVDTMVEAYAVSFKRTGNN